MKKEDFYYDSRDNSSKIHAVRYSPEDTAVRGVIQIVHGMAEYVERYEEFAEFLTGHGYLVTGEDHLGHGWTADQGGTRGYFCEQDPATVVVRDVHRLKKMTQQEFPGIPYYIIGHSMGSFILRNYLCRYGSGIDGAVIMGTGMQPGALLVISKALAAVIRTVKGPKHVSNFLDHAAFGGYNKRIPSPRTDQAWLSRDEERVKRYIADPYCGFTFTVNGFETLFELISRIRSEKNLRKIPSNLPVFMVSGAEDPVGDYGRGVRKAYESMKAVGMNRMELKLYEADRHELLNELDRDQVMQDILEWIESL